MVILQEKLIYLAKNKNNIIGNNGFSVPNAFCGYYSKNCMKLDNKMVDHSAVPLLIRPGYLKLDAWNNIFRLFGGEDISLSLNSNKLCNVTSIKFFMNLTEMQRDGNNQRKDKQIVSLYNSENQRKFDLFKNLYCFLIHSGYTPRRWINFKLPVKDYLNILIKHKNFI